MDIFTTLSKYILAASMALGLISSPVIQIPVETPQTIEYPQVIPTELGAAVPNTPALFDSYLASGITKTDTTMTLASGVLRNGQSLSGFTCFVLDVNQPTVEYVCGTASSTSVTSLMRGVDLLNPNATSSSLAFSHRRFASATITDYPTIQYLVRKSNATEGYDVPLIYSSAVATTTFTDPQQLVDKGYADSLAFNGAAVINANTTSKGVVEIATATEVSSSTAIGSTGATLVIPASQASSTWTSATLASGIIPVAKPNTGKIDNGFISTSTLFVNSSFTGTTTVASTTVVGSTNALDIGKTRFIATTSTTFTAPSGVKKIFVQVQAPGGFGGWGDSGAGSGASGSYSEMYVDLSATSSTSFSITISSATSTFSSYIICPGGGSAISSTAGVAPAACTGGDFKVNGRQGRVVSAGFAAGADSFLGIGGAGKNGGAEAGSGYGSGGGGTNSAIGIGGDPGPGIVLITY